MKVNKLLRVGAISFLAILSISTFILPVFAASSDFFPGASQFYQRYCTKKHVPSPFVISCYVYDRLNELEAQVNNQAGLLNDLQNDVATNSADIAALKGKKSIVDVAQVRGANWETSTINTPIETPDHVTVNCPEGCVLWVNYDVDTRNPNGSIGQSSWPQHLYHIYVDGVNQAVFNQASMIVANAAIPLAVNGVFSVGAGQHTVTIYALTTGGTLQQFESHLQVLAIH